MKNRRGNKFLFHSDSSCLCKFMLLIIVIPSRYHQRSSQVLFKIQSSKHMKKLRFNIYYTYLKEKLYVCMYSAILQRRGLGETPYAALAMPWISWIGMLVKYFYMWDGRQLWFGAIPHNLICSLVVALSIYIRHFTGWLSSSKST